MLLWYETCKAPPFPSYVLAGKSHYLDSPDNMIGNKRVQHGSKWGNSKPLPHKWFGMHSFCLKSPSRCRSSQISCKWGIASDDVVIFLNSLIEIRKKDQIKLTLAESLERHQCIRRKVNRTAATRAWLFGGNISSQDFRPFSTCVCVLVFRIQGIPPFPDLS